MKLANNVLFYIIAILVTVGFVGVLGLFIFRAVPEGNSQALSITLGAFTGAFMTVVNYFFGSSKGSAEKTEAMITATSPAKA
jgi:uncharacterized membrane protein YqiK